MPQRKVSRVCRFAVDPRRAFSHKASGLRFTKNDTVHIWDGQNIVAEMNGNGGVTARYIRGIGLIAGDLGAERSYYNFNAHGDVVQLSDETGAVVKEYRYDAFGVEQSPDSEDANVWRYCGEYFDVETGTVYLRARYYDPVVGRFINEDPIRSGLNWYTYCANNPVTFIDPLGLKMVSLRTIAESYGGTVSWNQRTMTAAVTFGQLGTKHYTAAKDWDNAYLYRITNTMMIDDQDFIDQWRIVDSKTNDYWQYDTTIIVTRFRSPWRDNTIRGSFNPSFYIMITSNGSVLDDKTSWSEKPSDFTFNLSRVDYTEMYAYNGTL